MRALLLTATGVAALTAAALCAPAAAQTPADLEAAASDLEALLAPASRLAAAAALHHERTGRFPDAPFALLGGAEGAQTGARSVALSVLDVRPAGDSLVLAYTLLPTPASPTDRSGTMTVTAQPDGTYEARFALGHHRDADHGGGRLAVWRDGAVRLERAGGRLCVAPERVRALAATGALDSAVPYLGPDGALTVSFSRHPDGPAAGEVRLPLAR